MGASVRKFCIIIIIVTHPERFQIIRHRTMINWYAGCNTSYYYYYYYYFLFFGVHTSFLVQLHMIRVQVSGSRFQVQVQVQVRVRVQVQVQIRVIQRPASPAWCDGAGRQLWGFLIALWFVTGRVSVIGFRVAVQHWPSAGPDFQMCSPRDWVWLWRRKWWGGRTRGPWNACPRGTPGREAIIANSTRGSECRFVAPVCDFSLAMMCVDMHTSLTDVCVSILRPTILNPAW